MIHDSDFKEDGGEEDGEMWSALGSVSKKEPIVFAHRLVIGYKSQRWL